MQALTHRTINPPIKEAHKGQNHKKTLWVKARLWTFFLNMKNILLNISSSRSSSRAKPTRLGRRAGPICLTLRVGPAWHDRVIGLVRVIGPTRVIKPAWPIRVVGSVRVVEPAWPIRVIWPAYSVQVLGHDPSKSLSQPSSSGSLDWIFWIIHIWESWFREWISNT